jgi:hypothetical protein
MKILVAHWPIGCASKQCSSLGGIMAMLLGGDSTIMIWELDVVDRIGYPQSFGRLHLGPSEESKFQGTLALNVLFGVRWEESQPNVATCCASRSEEFDAKLLHWPFVSSWR